MSSKVLENLPSSSTSTTGRTFTVSAVAFQPIPRSIDQIGHINFGLFFNSDQPSQGTSVSKGFGKLILFSKYEPIFKDIQSGDLVYETLASMDYIPLATSVSPIRLHRSTHKSRLTITKNHAFNLGHRRQ